MYRFSTKKTGKIYGNSLKEIAEQLEKENLSNNTVVYDLNENEITGNCTLAYFKTQV